MDECDIQIINYPLEAVLNMDTIDFLTYFKRKGRWSTVLFQNAEEIVIYSDIVQKYAELFGCDYKNINTQSGVEFLLSLIHSSIDIQFGEVTQTTLYNYGICRDIEARLLADSILGNVFDTPDYSIKHFQSYVSQLHILRSMVIHDACNTVKQVWRLYNFEGEYISTKDTLSDDSDCNIDFKDEDVKAEFKNRLQLSGLEAVYRKAVLEDKDENENENENDDDDDADLEDYNHKYNNIKLEYMMDKRDDAMLPHITEKISQEEIEWLQQNNTESNTETYLPTKKSFISNFSYYDKQLMMLLYYTRTKKSYFCDFSESNNMLERDFLSTFTVHIPSQALPFAHSDEKDFCEIKFYIKQIDKEYPEGEEDEKYETLNQFMILCKVVRLPKILYKHINTVTKSTIIELIVAENDEKKVAKHRMKEIWELLQYLLAYNWKVINNHTSTKEDNSDECMDICSDADVADVNMDANVCVDANIEYDEVRDYFPFSVSSMVELLLDIGRNGYIYYRADQEICFRREFPCISFYQRVDLEINLPFELDDLDDADDANEQLQICSHPVFYRLKNIGNTTTTQDCLFWEWQ